MYLRKDEEGSGWKAREGINKSIRADRPGGLYGRRPRHGHCPWALCLSPLVYPGRDSVGKIDEAQRSLRGVSGVASDREALFWRGVQSRCPGGCSIAGGSSTSHARLHAFTPLQKLPLSANRGAQANGKGWRRESLAGGRVELWERVVWEALAKSERVSSGSPKDKATAADWAHGAAGGSPGPVSLRPSRRSHYAIPPQRPSATPISTCGLQGYSVTALLRSAGAQT